MLAPFLQEIGIALGLLQDLGHRPGGEGDALPFSGLAERILRRRRLQLVHRHEFEQTLRVGFGASGLPHQLRQARRHKGDRQLRLAGAMQGGDERRQLLLWNILQLVDEQHDRRIGLFRRFAHRHEQIRQIAFQIAAVGDASFARHVHAELDIAVFHLEGLGETAERPQRRRHLGLHGLLPAQPQQGGAKGGDQNARQGAVFRRLDVDRGDTPFHGAKLDIREQNGLADAAQSIEDHAAGRPATPDAVKRNGGFFDDLVTARQFRWACPGAWRIGVLTRIHPYSPYERLSNFDNLT